MLIMERVVLDNWPVRVRMPDGKGPFPVFLLLHGLTGDEEAMWVFTPRLPQTALIIAPRGLYPAGPAGYSWYESRTRRWPMVDELQLPVERLLLLLNSALFPEGDFGELHLVGFSQGAATAFAFTLIYPERVSSVAGLAGFMPEGVDTLIQGDRLRGLPAFVTHGTQDKLVPIERGRQAARLLTQAGAMVTYCEDDVGHKLSLNCFRGLEAFYKNNLIGWQDKLDETS